MSINLLPSILAFTALHTATSAHTLEHLQKLVDRSEIELLKRSGGFQKRAEEVLSNAQEWLGSVKNDLASEPTSSSAAAVSPTATSFVTSLKPSATAVAGEAANTTQDMLGAIESNAKAALYDPMNNLNTTQKIGIIVGTVIAVLLMIGVTIACFRRRRNRTENLLGHTGEKSQVPFDDRATALPTRRRKSYKVMEG